MKSTVLISVLMPAYNAGEYLSESIESILDQTEKNFELLILDDASQDDTYKISQKYSKKDKRIRVLQNKKNLDIAGSRNRLVSESKGKYIAWQDADDISVPQRLEWQREVLENNLEVGIVGGNLDFFDESGTISVRKFAQDDDTLRKRIFLYSPVAQPAAMIRKVALDKIGPYGENLPPAEDIDMSFRLGTQYLFANVPHTVLRYRVHNSATFQRLRKIEVVTLRTRFHFAFHPRYRKSLTPFSIIFNVLQAVSMYIVPTGIRIWLFNKIRNSQV